MSAPQSAADLALQRTPLFSAHVAAGARMVAFAGYAMPVQFAAGVLKEHLWTRAHAGLFDVSHMGLFTLRGPDHATTARALEALVPADILALAPGRQRYTQLLDENGGIIDDLMVTRPADGPAADGALLLVVNAARKSLDEAYLAARLPSAVALDVARDRALIALQGPDAAGVLARFVDGVGTMPFMTGRPARLLGRDVHVTRSGYTGEDGYEIAAPASHATEVWEALAGEPEVRPAGLGARDSLRLEAGLCLYGHELDETVSPIEAGLSWSVPRRRREEGGFPGAARIQAELANGPRRRRVGIRPEGRAPAREGTEIRSDDGAPIGVITSGGFAPSLNAPAAMGFVTADHARSGTPLQLVVRGRPLAAKVVDLPFVPHRYYRG
jgi:aminomethyltransferase